MIKRSPFFFAPLAFLSVCVVAAFGAADWGGIAYNLTLSNLTGSNVTVNGTVDLALTHDPNDTVSISMYVPPGGSAELKGAGSAKLTTSYKLTGAALMAPDPAVGGWIDSATFINKPYLVKTPASSVTDPITLHIQGTPDGKNPPAGNYSTSFVFRATW